LRHLGPAPSGPCAVWAVRPFWFNAPAFGYTGL